MKDDYFNQHHRQTSWADLFPKPPPRMDDRPTAEDLARVEDDNAGEKSGPIRQTQALEAAKPHPAPESMKETPVAATPAIQPFNESREQALQKQFADESAEITRDLTTLREKYKTARHKNEIRPGLISQITELKDRGAGLRERWAKSEFQQDLTVFHRWHKRLTELRGFFLRPADDADSLFTDATFQYQQQEKRKERDEQLRREAAQRASDEAARAATVKELVDEGRVEEAKIVQEAPPAPIHAPAPKADPLKAIAPGTSARGVPKLVAIRDYEKFVTKVLVRDPNRLAELFDEKPSKFTAWLSSHMDKQNNELSIDAEEYGIEVEIVGATRRTGKHE